MSGYPMRLSELITGENQSLGALEVIDGVGEYETVAASQTDQVLGATGAAGDYLHRLICVVSTAANSQVQIKDGSAAAVTILPANVGGGIGTYVIPVGLKATGAGWGVTTGSGVTVIAVGAFT
jgi:hypothetical protein